MSDTEETAAPLTEVAAPDATALKAELVRERFETVAMRAGLDESVVDLVAPAAHAWLEKNKREATREALGEFMAELKQSKPKLFASAAPSAPVAPAGPRNTAPTMPNQSPAVPQPAAIETPFTRWRSLLSAGRRAEAEAFYRAHRRSIARTS